MCFPNVTLRRFFITLVVCSLVSLTLRGPVLAAPVDKNETRPPTTILIQAERGQKENLALFLGALQKDGLISDIREQAGDLFATSGNNLTDAQQQLQTLLEAGEISYLATVEKETLTSPAKLHVAIATASITRLKALSLQEVSDSADNRVTISLPLFNSTDEGFETLTLELEQFDNRARGYEAEVTDAKRTRSISRDAIDLFRDQRTSGRFGFIALVKPENKGKTGETVLGYLYNNGQGYRVSSDETALAIDCDGCASLTVTGFSMTQMSLNSDDSTPGLPAGFGGPGGGSHQLQAVHPAWKQKSQLKRILNS